jgi:hypothetical protein
VSSRELPSRSLIDLARGRIESGSASLMTMADAGTTDGVVVDILYRELCNAREQLHTNFNSDGDDYAALAERFKQKVAAASRPVYSTTYLETLSQFNDGRIPGNLGPQVLLKIRYTLGWCHLIKEHNKTWCNGSKLNDTIMKL